MNDFRLVRKSAMTVALLAGAATATLMGSSTPGAAGTAICESLSGLSLPQTTITAAQSIPAGTFTAADGEVFTNLPAFCRIAATLSPSVDSSIRIELWMPVTGWNGRFEGTGNGGYAGTIAYPPMADGVQRGNAVANTDMGTAPSTVLNGDPLIGHPEKWIDFGYRATHEMTVRSKQIVEAFYGGNPKFSYFSGCSTGGQQALSEAQRFPDDYDGIVAGASAYNRTHLHTAVVWDFLAARKTAHSLVPQSKLAVLNQAIVAACNTQDGGVSTDNWLIDPRDCKFDPAQLQCKGADAATCLTADQVSTMRAIYGGPRNPRTNDRIYPGLGPRGSEGIGITALLEAGGFPLPTDALFDSLFKWVFGALWVPENFNFDSDMARVDEVLRPILNATNPDLSAFRQRHGKLIMFHGFADGLLAPQDSINYYSEVVAQQNGNGNKVKAITVSANSNGQGTRASGDDAVDVLDPDALHETQKFARLFMAPGMSHCGGGPGANVFNGDDNLGGPRDSDHDVLSALVRWVEQGDAPDRIIATKFVNDKPAAGVAFTRPLCPYPQLPAYRGTGDTNDAASFVCRADEPDFNQVPAPEYRR
jgi:feruloyl esterase